MKEDNEEEIKQEIKEEMEEETGKEHAEERDNKLKITYESTDEETAVEKVEVVDKETSEESSSVAGNVKCSHKKVVEKMCLDCGEAVEVEKAGTSDSFSYIPKDLRVEASEIEKLQKKYIQDLLKDKKLILVLDLDYTLLNSVRMNEVTFKENYLRELASEDHDDVNRSIFKINKYDILTKLRPFIDTFLKEANTLFEMYIYTMGERGYAIECTNLFDSTGVYFSSKVICKSDDTTMNQKGFDVVIGSENMVIILDDTRKVWQKHKENLIVMKRYRFFAKEYNTGSVSLSEDLNDERGSNGILDSILNVLKRTHELFFDRISLTDNIDQPPRDVRQILQKIKKEILQDCNICIWMICPSTFIRPYFMRLRKLADAMGARCDFCMSDSVTHVVTVIPTPDVVEWAREKENGFVVNPDWIEEANYYWKRQKEEDFPALEESDQ